MPDQRPKGILKKTPKTYENEIDTFIQILPDNEPYQDLISILKIQLNEFKIALTKYPFIKMMISGFPPEKAITNFINQINNLTLTAEAKAEKEEVDTAEKIAPETKIAPKELSSTLYTVYKRMKECKVASQSFLDDYLLKLLNRSLNDPIAKAKDKKPLLEEIQKDVIRLKGTTKGRELAELCIEYINNPTDADLEKIEKKTLEHQHPLSFFRPKYPTSYQHFIIANFKQSIAPPNEAFNKLNTHQQFFVAMLELKKPLKPDVKLKAEIIKKQHNLNFTKVNPTQSPNSTPGPANN